MSEKEKSGKQSIKQTFGAVFGAFLGVRSSKDHNDDNEKISARSYIIVGIIGTIIFIGVLQTIVQVIIHLTAK